MVDGRVTPLLSYPFALYPPQPDGNYVARAETPSVSEVEKSDLIRSLGQVER